LSHPKYCDDQQHDQRKNGDADPAACAPERMPDFLIEIEVVGACFADHGPFPEPPQADRVALVKIIKALRRRWRSCTSLTKVFDDVPFLAQDRNHVSILP
jgi:hypothetical protein